MLINLNKEILILEILTNLIHSGFIERENKSISKALYFDVSFSCYMEEEMDSYVSCFSYLYIVFLNIIIYIWDIAKPSNWKTSGVHQILYKNERTIQGWSGIVTLKSIIHSVTWLYKYILLIRVDWWNLSV